jgi:hypothetical protein
METSISRRRTAADYATPTTNARRIQSNPEVLAQCRDLRALQIALAPVAFYDDLGDIDGWNDGISSMLDRLAGTS